MLKPLPPDDLPVVTVSVAALAEAKRAGFLTIHDNGVLTVAIPGRPVVQVTTPAKVRDRQHPAMSANGDFPEREHSTPEGALFAQMFPNGKVPKLGPESSKLGMPRKARRKAAGEPPCAGASDTGPGQPADG
jgi:hypothetical protein